MKKGKKKVKGIAIKKSGKKFTFVHIFSVIVLFCFGYFGIMSLFNKLLTLSKPNPVAPVNDNAQLATMSPLPIVIIIIACFIVLFVIVAILFRKKRK